MNGILGRKSEDGMYLTTVYKSGLRMFMFDSDGYDDLRFRFTDTQKNLLGLPISFFNFLVWTSRDSRFTERLYGSLKPDYLLSFYSTIS